MALLRLYYSIFQKTSRKIWADKVQKLKVKIKGFDKTKKNKLSFKSKKLRISKKFNKI